MFCKILTYKECSVIVVTINDNGSCKGEYNGRKRRIQKENYRTGGENRESGDTEADLPISRISLYS